MYDYYSDNVYSDDYYLVQYFLTAIFLKNKYCCFLLTKEECQILKERIPGIIINELYRIENSEYIAYEIYKTN